MSRFAVDKVLHQLRDPDYRARFQQDPRAMLASYDLTPQEASALAEGDIPALHRLGANGYLLLAFGHQAGVTSFRALAEAMAEPSTRDGPMGV